jgi:two-component system alkaline phosphatase synthesis response regulator PhoP
VPEKNLLLVEDEPSLVLTLTDRLESEGYSVTACGDGALAVELASSGNFDILVLDVQLPGKDGFEVCQELRREGITTPILMLTARSQVVDRVVGLKLGADDYLTKPFEMMELLARLEALLRRVRPNESASTAPSVTGNTASFGDITVDFRAAIVTRNGKPIEVSALEFKLLRYFVENQNAVLSRDQLLAEVWGYQASTHTRTVDVHVSSLRQKIEPVPSKPRHLVTVHGMGYRFVG